MPYFLKHYFELDFDPANLRPKEQADGSVDHYDLQYVQNVITQQVLAEFKEVTQDEAQELDPKFVFSEKKFPVGKHCRVNPENPDQLLADKNGYALYHKGNIAVFEVLNVRGDINFHTGNVLFVGDLVVHGNVQDEFTIQARNVLVKGTIGAAEVVAQESIIAESGVKGRKDAVLRAGKDIKLPFCENAKLMAGESVLINGHCMHSYLYVGKQLAVKGRLQGGAAYCHNTVYVEEQLGGGRGTLTSLAIGYDPFSMLKAEELENAIKDLATRIKRTQQRLASFPEREEELAPLLEKAEKKLGALRNQQQRVKEKIAESDASHSCGLVAPGTILPVVELQIGESKYAVDTPLENVRFQLSNGEIRQSSPALTQK